MIPTVESQIFQAAANAAGPGAGAQGDVPQHLVDKFQALLAQEPPVPSAPSATESHNVVTQAIREQDGFFHQVPTDLDYMSQHAGEMNINQLASATIEMEFEVAQSTTNFQVKMAAAQSSKGAVETLMKNQ